MRIKIVGDGTPLGTRVFNAETGEQLQGVNYIVYEQDIVGPARVMLGFDLTSMEAVVDNVDMVDNVGDKPELTNA